MIDILSTALSGLNASRWRTSVAANNLANLNTPGYREQQAKSASGPNGQGAVVDSVSISSTPGYLVPTDNPLDMAIEGQGYFQVTDGQGNPSYTRDGSFQLDSDGALVNSKGFRLDPPVFVPAEAENVTIAGDGTISATVDGQSQELGQIQLAKFSNPSGLSRQGGNAATQTGASGIPQTGTPGTEGRGIVHSGFVEGSNVNIAREAINLQVEDKMTKANAAVIRTADEMSQTVIDLIG